jgi:hypothetical protein
MDKKEVSDFKTDDFKPGDRVIAVENGLGVLITKEEFLKGRTEEMRKFYNKETSHSYYNYNEDLLYMKADNPNLCITQLTYFAVHPNELTLVDEKEVPKPNKFITDEDVNELKKKKEESISKLAYAAIDLAAKYKEGINRNGVLVLEEFGITLQLSRWPLRITIIKNRNSGKCVISLEERNKSIRDKLSSLYDHATNKPIIEGLKKDIERQVMVTEALQLITLANIDTGKINGLKITPKWPEQL